MARPTAGRLRIQGREVTRLPERFPVPDPAGILRVRVPELQPRQRGVGAGKRHAAGLPHGHAPPPGAAAGPVAAGDPRDPLQGPCAGSEPFGGRAAARGHCPGPDQRTGVCHRRRAHGPPGHGPGAAVSGDRRPAQGPGQDGPDGQPRPGPFQLSTWSTASSRCATAASSGRCEAMLLNPAVIALDRRLGPGGGLHPVCLRGGPADPAAVGPRQRRRKAAAAGAQNLPGFQHPEPRAGHRAGVPVSVHRRGQPAAHLFHRGHVRGRRAERQPLRPPDPGGADRQFPVLRRLARDQPRGRAAPATTP